MKKWGAVLNVKGSYISKIHSISTNAHKYFTTIAASIINIHAQQVEFYYSVSYDTVDWTNWVPINFNSTDLLDQYGLQNLSFRYKIVMSTTKEYQKPYIQAFSIDFDPCAVIENLGDFNLKPKLWITKRNGNGSIEIINTVTNQKMQLQNLIDNEEVYIHCQKEEIVSNRQNLGVYRYDDHNDEFLDLVVGKNYIQANGDFDMHIRYQHQFIQQ
ncbi:phage tail domain-containing protein [Lysinibacillus varians]|uniref:Phage tail-like C-terminal domain-containing protein n=1 Tax=Lysinibacillus varians TaxID=1145276 RepID=A0ABY2THI8_9BACI|nr:phage tail domain-containing protein [Lysinibacillus varians]AHN24043.1 hypothetical protein T479_07220 [Lysinibacillus varians]TKI67325.1 hypothetical protein FC752_02060 [Lysinibacillus varians]